MADLDAIIQSAMDAATDGDTNADAQGFDAGGGGAADSGGGTDGTDGPGDASGDAGAADASGADPDRAAAGEAAVDVDALTKELEGYGIKAPMEGQRENRIPYSRVVKIVGNAIKKRMAEFETERGAHTAKLTAAEKEVQEWRTNKELAAKDPDRYVQFLATLDPRFKRYIDAVAEGGQAAKVAAEQVPDAKDDPKPPPDGRYEDGTLGYTPAGNEKLMEWHRRQAVRETLAKTEEIYAKRFGPIERDYKAQQQVAALAPVVKAQIQRASETWGKPFKDHETEILANLQKYPDLPFDYVVAQTLLPKVRSDEATIRTKLMKEMNERSKAATPKPAAATTVTTGSADKEKSIEDIIKDSVSSAGLHF